MSVEIVNVSSKKQLKVFIDFVYHHYKDDIHYVPELYISQKWMLTKSNPFFLHSEAAYFLAYINGFLAGRIAAIVNSTHLEVYKDGTGFFGFFESIDNIEVAEALIDKSMEWLKQKGLKKMIGPTNLTTNDSCGFLIDGFDKPPVILMPYNKPYYRTLFEQCGFSKEIDLFSYSIGEDRITQFYQGVLERCQKRMSENGILIRNINLRKIDDEIKLLRIIYNKTNEKNWGFMPMNLNEFKALALQLKLTTPKEMVLIAEKAGAIIGFLVAVPDLNQAFIKIKNGRLFPFGIFKLLWYKHRINHARILILGVLPEYSNRGLDLLLYNKIKDILYSSGIFKPEACYIMESNRTMNSILHKLGGAIIKKYRLFQIEIK